MSEIPHISQREWLLMTALWEKHPQTAAEIVAKVQMEAKMGDSSIRTLIGRLVKKKAVGYTVDERNANLYKYYPLVCEQDCAQREGKNFLAVYYRNNIGKLVADVVGYNDISADEIEKLKGLLDRKKGHKAK